MISLGVDLELAIALLGKRSAVELGERAHRADQGPEEQLCRFLDSYYSARIEDLAKELAAEIAAAGGGEGADEGKGDAAWEDDRDGCEEG